MSSILACPDYAAGLVNLVGSMKSFIIQSDSEVSFTLKQRAKVILDEKYMPILTLYDGSEVNLVEIDLRKIIERLLDLVIPEPSINVIEQVTGYADFTAVIDTLVPIVFRVLKGGVAELNLLEATPWIEMHWLTWQPQKKLIIQHAPEWLGLYPLQAGNVMITAYFTDGTSYTGVYASLEAGKLYSINTSWSEVSEWLPGDAGSGVGSGDPVGYGQQAAWDVWFAVGGVQKTPVQRYQLRPQSDEEHLFVWVNTVGGIDSYSFTGSLEEDEKLEQKNSLFDNETIAEYDLIKPREYRQATGYLNSQESFWIKDFFYSRKKYKVRPDGSFGNLFSLKSVAVVSSKIISSSENDEFNYEFTYRLGTDEKLLNLDRTITTLPAPVGLNTFFLTDLLSSLTEASYHEALIMAVQSPYAIGWQKLSMAQLWDGGLPFHVDGTTIRIINSRLVAVGGMGGGDITYIDLIKSYLDSLNISYNDSQTILISGAMLWLSGLTYQSTDTVVYKIMGVRYTAVKTTHTLPAADPNLSRIDIFFADQYSNLGILVGTPALNPLKPELPETEVEVGSVLIGPGALTPGNADVEKVYDEHTEMEWTPSEVHDPDLLIDLDCLSEPLSGSKRIQVSMEAIVGHDDHKVGEAYHGGVIFKILSPTTGLIAAIEDTALSVFYESLSGGAPYNTGAHGIDIGTGKANSELLSLHPRAKDHAIKYCNDLLVGPFDDWYLPSEQELYAMYVNRFLIGNFATKTYWSSTEVTGAHDYDTARCVRFSDGGIFSRVKNNAYAVRAIRSYNDLTDPPDPNSDSYITCENTVLSFVAPEPVAVRDGILSINLKSPLPWRDDSMIRIESFLGTLRTGSVSMSKFTNMFSYRPGDDTWRMIAIQMYQLAPTQNTLDCFRLTLLGNWPNHLDLGFDDIRYQHGTVDPEQAKQEARWETDYGFVEPADGTRMLFTTLNPYLLNTTKISLNGVRQIRGEYKHYIEYQDKIYFYYPPEASSGWVIDYDTLVAGNNQAAG